MDVLRCESRNVLLFDSAGRRRMPRERIAKHLSERAPTDAGNHANATAKTLANLVQQETTAQSGNSAARREARS